MKKINNDWEFTSHYSDEFLSGGKADETVRIPHNVETMPLHYSDSNVYQKICGYRKTIFIPKEGEGKRWFIQFDAAGHIADVYCNGKHVAHHACGYTAFRAEITEQVNYGQDNIITVRLDTTENPEIPPFGFVIDYLTYGGIYRDVYLDERNKTFIADAWIRTPSLYEAELSYTLDGDDKDLCIRFEIIDAEGNIQAAKEAPAGEPLKLELGVARVWGIDHPYLYTGRITLLDKGEEVDAVTRTFGFRTISFNENQVILNDNPVFIRGLNRHQCIPYAGYALSDSLQVEDARILKEELGVNAVRTSHYPQSHAFIDACDRLGLLVFTEIPGWQHLGDEKWKEQVVENTKEMVIEYRQHPSIFLWGVRVNESLDDDELYKKTNEVAHELDPTRPTSGVRYLEKSSLLEDIYSYNDFSHNGLTPGAKPKKDVSPDLKKPLIISEANGHMFPTKSFDTFEKRQEHALRHARVMDAAMADGQHAGCFEWCMFDYATHKDFGSGDRICYHGVMDSFRNPKLAAAVYASQQDETPVLEVGSPMDIGDYPAGHIGNFWVFTNADEVKLFKNDEFVSSFKPKG
jgi:beta-galactosidase